jgi:hypothetical protein
MASCSVSLVITIKPKDKYATIPFVRHLISQKVVIMWHFRVVPRPEVMLFTRKKASLLKQTDLRVMFKKTFEYVCTSFIVLFPERSFSHSINFFSYEYYRKHTIRCS